MTPLLGTKNPSAPAGDKSGGERRAARAAAFQVFTNHETRDTNHGFCRGAAWGGYGAAWVAAVPRSATRPVGFSPATNHATCFPPALRRLQEEQLQARPTGFSRITNHETRITAFFESRLFIRFDALPTSAHHCPLLPGFARQKILSRQASARRPAFWLGLTAGLHVSPRGEVKWVRGPSGSGASRAEEKGACRCSGRIASLRPSYYEICNTAFTVYPPSDISSGAN